MNNFEESKEGLRKRVKELDLNSDHENERDELEYLKFAEQNQPSPFKTPGGGSKFHFPSMAGPSDNDAELNRPGSTRSHASGGSQSSQKAKSRKRRFTLHSPRNSRLSLNIQPHSSTTPGKSIPSPHSTDYCNGPLHLTDLDFFEQEI